MTENKKPTAQGLKPDLPLKKQGAPDDKSKDPARKWYAPFVPQVSVRPNQPEPQHQPVQAPRAEMTDKTAINTLERLVGQLETSESRPDQELLSAICAVIGSILKVGVDEVALLKLASHGMSLGFVLPARLQSAGVIPVESKVAMAARSVRERRPELDNNFAAHSHARVFEVISPEHQDAEPIQKIMSVPVLHGDELIGVAQISRKGTTAVAAGPDFTGKDLRHVKEINALLARIVATHTADIAPNADTNGTAAGAAATRSQTPTSLRLRRAPRVAIGIPIEVIYQGPENRPVAEDAQTFTVSEYGAGIILQRAPQVEQAIVVIHKVTREEVFCRVADTKPIPKSTAHEVGVAFSDPKPYFWRIAFPSPDSDPTERKQFSLKTKSR